MKRIKILFATLLVTSGIVAAFAFSNAGSEKVADESVRQSTVFFEYTGTLPPTSTTIVDPANWTQRTSLPSSCIAPRQVICAISFIATSTVPPPANQYNLDAGKPPFNTSTTFRNTILAHYSVPTDQGLTFNGVTFYYKPQP
ncbi:MAG: hypothetical protein P0Y53_03105 [Candidatus Pseudobacter hemicellulosilyticus]|uniref:Uncharacterized protein n=1 Tax=Candidatus Pseudobacter hemicellulosilyticus TaxID=3121375 RepID=A0AAJ5WTQ4_9BACT|nr:MAG: hypothetical protein P0Y53_03105 [Pseudobacter sp.]